MAMYKGRTYTTFIMPRLIWVKRRIPRVDAKGAAGENQSLDIKITKTIVTNIAVTLCE
jgi:hypothetical protein